MFDFVDKGAFCRSTTSFEKKRRHVVDGCYKRPSIEYGITEIGKVHEVEMISVGVAKKTGLLCQAMPWSIDCPLGTLCRSEMNFVCILFHDIDDKSDIRDRFSLQKMEQVAQIYTNTCLEIESCIDANGFHNNRDG